MRNTFFKLWIHGILHISEEGVPIQPDLAQPFYHEIEKRFVEQDCPIAAINGQSDHVHVLFTQNPLLTLHETMSFVQGMTQRWYQLNDAKTGWYKFKWDEGYCLYSVSESVLEKTQFFIEKQAEIHQNLNFWDERLQLNRLHKVDLSDLVLT